MASKSTVACDNCGHSWKTKRRYDAYCPKCGVRIVINPKKLKQWRDG
jgi:DNA-directed RNA polymerase subunit RPC12/RpoP